MTRPKQKERERSILHHYLQVAGLKGDVVDQERPDFFIRASARRIGVEIIEYHQPKSYTHKFSMIEVDSTWEKLKEQVIKYRQSDDALNNISVMLSFIGFSVPPQGKHGMFIQAIHSEIRRVRPGLTDRFRPIPIDAQHPAILRHYLHKIEVRVAKHSGWNWNHMVAGVGTSENEVIGVLETKLTLEQPEGIDELHLVLAGDGSTAAAYIGTLRLEQLRSWARLNEALNRSHYKVVAILSYASNCMWRRAQGWSLITNP